MQIPATSERPLRNQNPAGMKRGINDILVHFKPSNTLRRKLIHLKDKTPSKARLSIPYSTKKNAGKYTSGKLNNLLTIEWANTNVPPPQDGTHLLLKGTGHSLEDSQVSVLAREDH